MSVARQYFLIVWLTMMNMKITLVFFAAVCVTTGQVKNRCRPTGFDVCKKFIAIITVL